MNPQEFPSPLIRPAFSPIRPDDHAGQVWILTTLAVIYTGTSLIVRGSIKWNLFWLDDYLVAIATAIHLAQAGAVYYGLSHGLGKFNSITTETQWALSGKAFFTSEILAVVALCLAKCSVWALLLRIFVADGAFNDWRVKTCFGFVFLGVSWGVIAIIGVALSCVPQFMLSPDHNDQCVGQFARWQTLTALDVSTEILGCLLPVVLVWSLNMVTKSKFHVFLAFSFRLPLVVFSLLHLKYTKQYTQSAEPLFAVTNPLLCQQAMLTWSLLSATIPNIKSFMRVFNFSMGMGAMDEQHLSNQTPEPILLRSYGARTTLNEHAGSSYGNESALRPDVPHMHNKRNTTYSNGGTTDDEHSLRRNDSQEMIIKKEVQDRNSIDRQGGGV
ncbi:hypothetical protein VMCG_01330 [Cytospora schulzeri]|uniref:Rhodopsin domain-containing protein n=1 Tax=Cytospora schulzeri TaxID=448051 RepID=A0A423X760_9PEZI|nr:hypothetical protein VMCG_01330 [Valsa malicola]